MITASTAPDLPTAATATVETTSQLLEQLMQIARISALEEMASGIAHELNQPIGAITTFAQTGVRMLDRPEPMIGDAREVLHHISTEALKAGDGIRRIRHLFDRPDATRSGSNMAEVIAELTSLLSLLAQRAGSHLDIEIQPALPLVFIDRLRIQHVLLTLVQNALEAPRRHDVAPVVHISVSGDRYAVTTAVSDQGCGISPETRDQLFKPFFTSKPNGTGLGLASSRAIVEAHEGAIGFESASGCGARFWFRLPAYSGADAK